jgi:glycosyltransferase involved in cell wall biosynthesis
MRLRALPDRPVVSVLVANYNYAQYLPTALDSLRDQTYPQLDVVVCDDGSVDGSIELLERQAAEDDRITVIAKKNGGVASALNAAYLASRGQIICLLDADDYFERTKVERIVEAFQTHQWGLVVHPMMVVDAQGSHIQRKPALTGFESGWLGDRNLERGGRWMYMEASAVSLRRELADIAFPLSEEHLTSWADAYICTLCALVAEVGYVDEILAYYRLHSSNTSGFAVLSEAQARKGIDGVARVIGAVNDRLSAVGIDDVQVDPNRHLTLIESKLQADLFSGQVSRRELVSSFSSYVRVMRRDGLYSNARKVEALFFLGTAIALPAIGRARWVSVGMTESRFKERVRRLLQRARNVPGLSR